MDALALLCNLHAEGPATLQRLRRSACDSLTALRRLDPASLASLLDWNERAAERFLREAALLCERVQEDEPGAAPTDDHEFELESTLVEELQDEPGEDDGDDFEEELEPDDVDEDYAPPALAAERTEAVLDEWRELDRVSPPAEPTEFVIPRPDPLPDRSLHGLALEGLTPALRGRLAELGVHTLRHLAEARELDLARSIPLGFTRLKRLQGLAARELATLPVRPSPPPALSPAFEVFSPPPSDFETAGPFA